MLINNVLQLMRKPTKYPLQYNYVVHKQCIKLTAT